MGDLHHVIVRSKNSSRRCCAAGWVALGSCPLQGLGQDGDHRPEAGKGALKKIAQTATKKRKFLFVAVGAIFFNAPLAGVVHV